MTPQESARRARELFEAVMDLPPSERTPYLDHACQGETRLRQEVEELLKFFDSSQTDEVLPRLLGELPRASLVGEQVGPYHIRREIGEGGMGMVYLAEREDVGKRVALKLVRFGRLAASEQVERFLLERRVLARLEHPNIARLLDAGVTEHGLPYFVMEYVDGMSITQFCDERRLSINDRLTLIRQVCSAVHYAHRSLVVHRDLKPSNIFVTRDGEVKLLDFGIAKLLGEGDGGESPLTVAGATMLTPDYASPEQIRREPITTASDVYSLGVVLYELLSGHRPYRFSRRSAAEVEQVVCETEPGKPSAAVLWAEEVVHADGVTERITPEAVSRARNTQPERLRRRLDGDLDTIVLKALRKEPERRYGSAEQLSEDVRRHIE